MCFTCQSVCNCQLSLDLCVYYAMARIKLKGLKDLIVIMKNKTVPLLIIYVNDSKYWHVQVFQYVFNIRTSTSLKDSYLYYIHNNLIDTLMCDYALSSFYKGCKSICLARDHKENISIYKYRGKSPDTWGILTVTKNS